MKGSSGAGGSVRPPTAHTVRTDALAETLDVVAAAKVGRRRLTLTSPG